MSRVRGGKALQTAALVWTCQACGKPVADGTGYIGIRHSEIHRVEQARRDFEAERKQRKDLLDRFTYTAEDILAWPKSATWEVWHRRCDPYPAASTYWFDVARCRSAADLFRWTAHLSEKTWLGATDWDRLLWALAS